MDVKAINMFLVKHLFKGCLDRGTLDGIIFQITVRCIPFLLGILHLARRLPRRGLLVFLPATRDNIHAGSLL